VVTTFIANISAKFTYFEDSVSGLKGYGLDYIAAAHRMLLIGLSFYCVARGLVISSAWFKDEFILLHNMIENRF